MDVMDVYGCLWVFMGVYGYISFSMGFCESMGIFVFYGFLWVFMCLYGCLWVFMGAHGYLCVFIGF